MSQETNIKTIPNKIGPVDFEKEMGKLVRDMNKPIPKSQPTNPSITITLGDRFDFMIKTIREFSLSLERQILEFEAELHQMNSNNIAITGHTTFNQSDK